MTQEEKTKIEERIVDVLKTVYDPEIPVNIYDLGMIYKIDVDEKGNLDMDMTFTAPSCPAADFILEDVRTKVESVEGVKSASINLVFDPAWDQSMMSEEARVELGFDDSRMIFSPGPTVSRASAGHPAGCPSPRHLSPITHSIKT